MQRMSNLGNLISRPPIREVEYGIPMGPTRPKRGRTVTINGVTYVIIHMKPYRRLVKYILMQREGDSVCKYNAVLNRANNAWRLQKTGCRTAPQPKLTLPPEEKPMEVYNTPPVFTADPREGII